MKRVISKIKISDAAEIAEKYDKDMVIIIAINQDSSGHITTYGKTKNLCKLAGYIGQEQIGNYLFSEDGVLVNTDYVKALEDSK